MSNATVIYCSGLWAERRRDDPSGPWSKSPSSKSPSMEVVGRSVPGARARAPVAFERAEAIGCGDPILGVSGCAAIQRRGRDGRDGRWAMVEMGAAADVRCASCRVPAATAQGHRRQWDVWCLVSCQSACLGSCLVWWWNYR